MSWLAPAIVGILSGSVILVAVFLYLYERERESWMGIWGLAWLAYTARFGVELYQVLSGSDAIGPAVANNLLVLVTGVLLLEGTYALAGAQTPRWHRRLAVVAAVWTVATALLALSPTAVALPAWIFRGVANIAAGIVWYRSVSGTDPWGKITGASFVVWGVHNLDYPFLRGVAAFAPFGFMLGAFLEFIIAFGALIAYFERTRSLLRGSEARYRSIFENSASVMLIIDPVDSRIVQANPAAASYYGYSLETLTTMSVPQINVLSSEEVYAQIALAKSGRSRFSFTHRLASGELRDVEVYSGPVMIGGRELLYSIVHDVTDRAIAERQWRESEERYLTLFEHSLSPMLLVSTHSARILEANAAAARMYGWPVGELIGMGISDLSADSGDAINEEVAATVAEGGRARVFRHRRRDGAQIDVEIYSTPIVSRAQTVLYTIVNDISARMSAERELAEYRQHLEELVEERTLALSTANAELERASRAKDEYLTNMSHELRTPLNSIIGFSELLSRGMAGELNDEQFRQVDMINASGQHLLRVVDGVLDLARISAGAVEVTMQDVDVSMLCEEVAKRLAPIVDVQGIGLETCIEPDVRLRTDPVLLEQVLWNLLGNAAKFTDEGQVTLLLESRGQDVRIVVRDTGRGVHPEDQWRIFETFVRIEDETGARSDGTGLGLPISRRLIEVLGGRIEFDSAPGEGSEFTIVLPAGCSDAR